MNKRQYFHACLHIYYPIHLVFHFVFRFCPLHFPFSIFASRGKERYTAISNIHNQLRFPSNIRVYHRHIKEEIQQQELPITYHVANDHCAICSCMPVCVGRWVCKRATLMVFFAQTCINVSYKYPCRGDKRVLFVFWICYAPFRYSWLRFLSTKMKNSAFFNSCFKCLENILFSSPNALFTAESRKLWGQPVFCDF